MVGHKEEKKRVPDHTKLPLYTYNSRTTTILSLNLYGTYLIPNLLIFHH